MSLAPILQLPKVHFVPSATRTTDARAKDFLTEAEMSRLLAAATRWVPVHAAFVHFCDPLHLGDVPGQRQLD